jgi:hypothetical protein
MRIIQIISGISIVYFLIKCVIVGAEEAKMEALMGVITMFLVFLMSSHLYGKEKNDIADEIKENHKRNNASDNGITIVQGAKSRADKKATK